ncbi:MAB_1171c family putative transporter [Streptomyces sp. NPDC002143]
MSGLNYISGSVLVLGLMARLPDLVRHRRDPFLRAICAVLAFASLSFFLGAPPTVGAINRISGIPNLAAPLTYCTITGYCAASLVLIVCWRGGAGVQRTARRWVIGYGVVVIGIAVLFTLGDADMERRVDFDTYYATTPFIAEMVVLYLTALLVTTSVTAVAIMRWVRKVPGGWLRSGLFILGAGTVSTGGYSLTKLIAVVARWSGREWRDLATKVSPGFAGLGAVLVMCGIVIPLIGPRIRSWQLTLRVYRRLAPLERELETVLIRNALRNPPPHWFAIDVRLMWRQTSIHNGLNHLAGSFDMGLYEQARRAALAATGNPDQADATGWAATITVAATGTKRGQLNIDQLREDDRLRQVPTTAALIHIADALISSDIVARARLGDDPAAKSRA